MIDNYNPSLYGDVRSMCDPLRRGKEMWDEYTVDHEADPLVFVRDVNCVALRITGTHGGRTTWLTYDPTVEAFIVVRKRTTLTQYTLDNDETLLRSHVDHSHWWPWDLSEGYPTLLTPIVERNDIDADRYGARKHVWYGRGHGLRNKWQRVAAQNGVDTAWLHEQYMERDRSAYDIADELDTNADTIYNETQRRGWSKNE